MKELNWKFPRKINSVSCGSSSQVSNKSLVGRKTKLICCTLFYKFIDTWEVENTSEKYFWEQDKKKRTFTQVLNHCYYQQCPNSFVRIINLMLFVVSNNFIRQIFKILKSFLQHLILFWILIFKLSGGLGGLGLELIDWLILRGARNLVISSRKGITTRYQSWKIQKWKSRGAQIIIYTDDITKAQGVRNLLEKANALGPVVAIFNLAMVNNTYLNINSTAGKLFFLHYSFFTDIKRCTFWKPDRNIIFWMCWP